LNPFLVVKGLTDLSKYKKIIGATLYHKHANFTLRGALKEGYTPVLSTKANINYHGVIG